MKRNIIAAIVIFAMMIAAGCGNDDTKPADGSVANELPADTAVAETEEEHKPYIEPADYGGKEVRIITPKSSTNNYFFSDEETGDSLGDAIYTRTIMTEDYLGIKLTHTDDCEITDLAGIVSKSVMAGEDSYQIVLGDSMRGNTAMVSNGILFDLKKVSTLDFTHPYWLSDALGKLTINGNLYFMKSSYIIPSVGLVTYNKRMVDEFGLGSQYQLVDDGKWTLDVFIDNIKKVSADINGDSKMDINDQYGLVCMSDWPLDCMIYSSGLNLTTLNSNGVLELSIYNDKALTLYDKLYSLINDGDYSFHWPWGTDLDKIITMASDRALYELRRSTALEELRDSDVDFGIMPYPKFDESQADYSINDYSRNLCIPVTVSDPEMVGKVCEMLAYYSDEFVYSSYYDGLLNGKIVRDEESIRMLDIIFDSVIFDGGMTYFGLNGGGMQNLMYFISTQIAKGKGDFASYYEKNYEKAANEIAEFYDSISG